MSPLPERKKTAEELAALRESLGIDPDGPPPGPPPMRQGEVIREEAPPVQEAEQPVEPAVATPPPKSQDPLDQNQPPDEADRDLSPSEVPRARKTVLEHSLRKSASLPVDQPKPKSEPPPGVIPARKRSEKELEEIRQANLRRENAVAELVLNRKASTGFVLTIYGILGLPVAVMLIDAFWFSRLLPMELPADWVRWLIVQEWYKLSLVAFVAGSCLMALLTAGWLIWKRPLSRHHAGFITIIAMLVAAFGTLYFLPVFNGA